MQKQKIDKTYCFSLLMLLEMLNKARKPLYFRTVGKWSKSVCAQAQTKQYGSKAVRHSANIEKKSPPAKSLQVPPTPKAHRIGFFLAHLKRNP